MNYFHVPFKAGLYSQNWYSDVFKFGYIFILLWFYRLCDHEKVVEGLTNLGFILLSVSGIKSKETILKKIWRIGRITLVSLIKKHRKISKNVLQNLTDRIITGCTSQQYTGTVLLPNAEIFTLKCLHPLVFFLFLADCLLHLCTVASSVMVDNFSVVMRILEFIDSMPSVVSQRIITALIPLVQISSSLRDSLIMYSRKALFSRLVKTFIGFVVCEICC